MEGEIISLQRDRLSVMQIFGGKSYKRELEEYITIVVLAPILFGRTVFIACFTTILFNSYLRLWPQEATMSSSGRQRYNLRNMDSVFREFQEVFGGSEDEQQSERERTQEDARRSRRKRRRPMIADSSPEPQDQRTDRNNQQQQRDDAPAWANKLLRSQ